MTNLVVHGGKPLRGSLRPSANKNAVLPILCGSLLTRERVVFRNVPDITDVGKLVAFFRMLGSEVDWDAASGTLALNHHEAVFDPEIHRLPERMRSSIMLAPPLLSRYGVARIEADVTGCTLGVREIDPHIQVISRFGGTVEIAPDALLIRAGRMQAARHWLDYASVTATENFVLCAVLAQGDSRLTNAACEPHVQELCAFLSGIGAEIGGVGTSQLTIRGVERLSGGEYTFQQDFHEIATMIALAAITGGEVSVQNSTPEIFPLIDRTFEKFGVHVEHSNGWSHVNQTTPLRIAESFTSNVLQKVEAAPWPYVPVDLLPIFIALGVKSEGCVLYWNKVYDGALGWSTELSKFGAQVSLADPHRLITFGGKRLAPAEVESPYIIRVAIALLMIAASIPGRSVIRAADPIRRAHPHFAENLRSLGADVEWTDAR